MVFILEFLKQWRDDQRGVVATEFVFIFPVMLTLLLGVFDLGYGILAAQKTIRASQVTADLIARHESVTDAEINEAVSAGELSLSPFDAGSFAYNIVSLEFTDDSGTYDELWSRSSSGASFSGFSVDSLGNEGSGLVVVQVSYEYEPLFSGLLFDTFTFAEVSFVRGRTSETIPFG